MSKINKEYSVWHDPFFDEVFIAEKEHVSAKILEQLAREKVKIHSVSAETPLEAREKVFGPKKYKIKPSKMVH